MNGHQQLLTIGDLSAGNVRSLVTSFQGKRILVIGDLMLDEYLGGDVQRISPEAPVPIVHITHRAHVPGGAANVAANVAALGGQPIVLGLVGNDENGDCLKAVLQRQGVTVTSIIATANRPTITKTRIVSGQQQIVRIDREVKSPIDSGLEEQILAEFSSVLSSVDACIVSDYAKGLLTPSICQTMISRAIRQGKPTVVDPKGSSFAKYAGCTVMTPNLREAEIASSISVQSELDLFAIADKLAATTNDASLLITRGADGMSLFRQRQQAVHVAAKAHEVFDVTGAGDSVASTLVLALAGNAALDEAMVLSNLAASVVVQKTGTATLTPDELIREGLGVAPGSIRTKAASAGATRSYLSVPNQVQLTQ